MKTEIKLLITNKHHIYYIEDSRIDQRITCALERGVMFDVDWHINAYLRARVNEN